MVFKLTNQMTEIKRPIRRSRKGFQNKPEDYLDRIFQEFLYKQVAVLLDSICENCQFVLDVILHMNS